MIDRFHVVLNRFSFVVLCSITVSILFFCVGCSEDFDSKSSNSSSISDSETISKRSTGSLNSSDFVDEWNNLYPENQIAEEDIDNYLTGAGSGADVVVKDVVCEFGESDGTPTFTVLSDLPLSSSGRKAFLEQAAKVIAVEYDLSLSTSEDIMSEFEDATESKSYRFDGITFSLMFEHYHRNYELFTIKH